MNELKQSQHPILLAWKRCKSDIANEDFTNIKKPKTIRISDWDTEECESDTRLRGMEDRAEDDEYLLFLLSERLEGLRFFAEDCSKPVQDWFSLLESQVEYLIDDIKEKVAEIPEYIKNIEATDPYEHKLTREFT